MINLCAHLLQSRLEPRLDILGTTSICFRLLLSRCDTGKNESQVTPNHPGMCCLQQEKVEKGSLPQNLAMAMLRGENGVGAEYGSPAKA